jgi:hypothetical protein
MPDLKSKRYVFQLTLGTLGLPNLSVNAVQFTTADTVKNGLVQSVMMPYAQSIIVDPKGEDQKKSYRYKDGKENR